MTAFARRKITLTWRRLEQIIWTVAQREGPILVVEDDSEMREAIVTVLERQGWATVTVADGAEAVAQLDELRPRLLLVDLMLPRMSGWELLQCLRETQKWREIPTLVLTGFPRENLRVTADAVLHKPVDYDRLVKVVGRLIGPGSARAEQPDRVSDA